MCIIAYSPKGTEFKQDEVVRMWNKNPDGAGIAVRNPETNRVIFKKGIMNKKELLNIVDTFNKKELELVIHCRITSRGETNEKQTHPFKSRNIKSLGHINVQGDLYFMNGTITEIKVKDGYNDTMTFIESMQLNKIKPTQDLIDMIGDVTGARWLCVSKEGIFYTSDFIKHDDKFYSNRNHAYSYPKYSNKKTEKKSKSKYYDECCSIYADATIENSYSKTIQHQIKKEGIYDELKYFLDTNCNTFKCDYCFECILYQNNVKNIKNILEDHQEFYLSDMYLWEE